MCMWVGGWEENHFAVLGVKTCINKLKCILPMGYVLVRVDARVFLPFKSFFYLRLHKILNLL